MTEKIQGIVKAAPDKGDKYAINIDGVWFNAFGKSPAKKGDEVIITYEQNGQWKNIKHVEVLKSAPQENRISSEESSRRRHILDCVLKAADMVCAGKTPKDQLFAQAKELYAFALAMTETETESKFAGVKTAGEMEG